MGLYYAQHGFQAGIGAGKYTSNLVRLASSTLIRNSRPKWFQLALLPFLSWPTEDPAILLGDCSMVPVISLGSVPSPKNHPNYLNSLFPGTEEEPSKPPSPPWTHCSQPPYPMTGYSGYFQLSNLLLKSFNAE